MGGEFYSWSVSLGENSSIKMTEPELFVVCFLINSAGVTADCKRSENFCERKIQARDVKPLVQLQRIINHITR